MLRNQTAGSAVVVAAAERVSADRLGDSESDHPNEQCEHTAMSIRLVVNRTRVDVILLSRRRSRSTTPAIPASVPAAAESRW